MDIPEILDKKALIDQELRKIASAQLLIAQSLERVEVYNEYIRKLRSSQDNTGLLPHNLIDQLESIIQTANSHEGQKLIIQLRQSLEIA